MAEPTEDLPPEQYLGDGVYASFDGYQIWLAVNHHSNKVVAIDKNVFFALANYSKMVVEFYNARRRENRVGTGSDQDDQKPDGE